MFSLPQKISGNSSSEGLSLQKKTLLTFAVGVLIIVTTLILHSYPQYQESQEHKASILKIETELAEQKSTLSKIDRELQKFDAQYKVVLENSKTILDKVFPPENHTDGIVTFLEDFSLHYNTKKHPLKIESLSFSKPIKAKGYMILPFRTNITADMTNFNRFMKMVENSGSLDKKYFFKKTIVVPAFSLIDIGVSFPKEDDLDPASLIGNTTSNSPAVQAFSFGVSMHAYFRTK